MRHQLVVHEPGAIHRFHDPANWLPIHGHPTGKPVQAVAIRGRGEAVDQLPLIGDQADIDSFATQIQTNMQHDDFLLSPARQAGSILPTAYRDRWSVLCFGRLGPRGLPPRAASPMLFDTEGRPPPRRAPPPGPPAFIAVQSALAC